MRFSNKTIMLTGASGCIGRATAELLAKEGASLILCDLKEETLLPVAEKARAFGVKVMTFCFDVRDYKAAQIAVKKALTEFGKIDAQINIAGGSAGLINKLSNFVDSEPETWDFVMGINVRGSFNCVHAVLPHMIEQKAGKIILFGSVAGVGGLAGRADYSAAKGALDSFTKALAMEVGKYNIAVNCVSPGAIHRQDTPTPHMTYWGADGNSSDAMPVAKMCAFLASDDSDFITGQNYQVDGGRTLGSLK